MLISRTVASLIKYNGRSVGIGIGSSAVTLLIFSCFLVGSVWTNAAGEDSEINNEVVTLRTCCEFQSQYSQEGNECKDKSESDGKSFGSIFNLPNSLLNHVFENSTEGVKFRLERETPTCSKGSFMVNSPIRKKKKSNDPKDQISFIPNGYLQIGHEYYSPKEFCIDKINEDKISLAVCHPACDENRPCLVKCCEFGEIWDFAELHHGAGVPICRPSGEKQWEPTLYSDRYTKMGAKDMKHLAPHYLANHPSLGWCELGHPFIISLKNTDEASHGIIFRVLRDGSVITRIRRRQWNYLPSGDYCIDGAMNLNTVGSPFMGYEDDTVVLYCHKDVQTSEATISTIYGISMTISSLFLILTLIVFLALWRHHKDNWTRWTVFCYVLTLLFMYFFFILSYFSPYFDQETLTNGGMCRAIGIGMHFFFLSTFSWLTALNFEIFWTVRALQKTVRAITGIKRLISYGIFSFGVPTIIVSIGLILAFIYDDALEDERIIIPEYGRFTCNIGSRDAFWAYMYGPVGVLLLSNLIFFLTTVTRMWRLQQRAIVESNPPTKHQQKQSDLIKLFAKLYILMGMPWVFEVISFAVQEDQFKWYWLLFDMINIFQSVGIFFIFACNRETVVELVQKFPILKPICCFNTTKGNDSGRRASNLDDSKLSSIEIAPKEIFEMNGQQEAGRT